MSSDTRSDPDPKSTLVKQKPIAIIVIIIIHTSDITVNCVYCLSTMTIRDAVV